MVSATPMAVQTMLRWLRISDLLMWNSVMPFSLQLTMRSGVWNRRRAAEGGERRLAAPRSGSAVAAHFVSEPRNRPGHGHARGCGARLAKLARDLLVFEAKLDPQ